MSRGAKRLVFAGAGVVTFLALGAAAVAVILRMEWFHTKVRQRIIAEVEKATGGEASLTGFQFNWALLEANVSGFTLRGTEQRDHPPLFRADSVVIGLKLVSALRRDIDIALLRIERPQVSIEEDENGRTNIPEPQIRREKGSLVEPFLKLAIQRIEISQGVARYMSNEVPIELSGEDLDLRASYEFQGPRYRGRLSVKQLRIVAPERVPVVFDSDADWALERQRLELSRVHLRLPKSTAEVSGVVENFSSPLAVFNVKAQIAMAEIVELAKLPILPQGSSQFAGTVSYAGGKYSATAGLAATDLAIRRGRVAINRINVSSSVEVLPGMIDLKHLNVRALQSTFDGAATIHDLERFSAQGTVRDLPIQELTRAFQVRNVPWDGQITGPVGVQGRLEGTGVEDAKASGKVAIRPAEQGRAVAGSVEVLYEQRANRIVFGPSQLETQSSSIIFSGVLRDRMQVEVTTANPNDLLTALAVGEERAVPASLPVELSSGSTIRFEGAVSRPLEAPHIEGRLSVGPFRHGETAFDYLAAGIDINGTQLRLEDISLRQREAHLRGYADVALVDWRVQDSSAVGGELSLTGLPVPQVIKRTGRDAPITGTLSGAAKLGGTKASPQVLATIRINNPAAYGEQFDFLEAEGRYADRSLEIASGALEAGGARIGFNGSYVLSEEDWKTGELKFSLGGRSVTLAQWRAFQKARAGMDANVEWQFTGEAQIRKGQPRLRSLAGDLNLTDLTMNKRKLGMAHLTASSRKNLLLVNGNAGLIDATLELSAEWSLERDSFGLGNIQFTGLTLGGLQDVGLLGSRDKEIATGVFDGDVAFSGPVLRPDRWQGMARITRMEVSPAVEGVVKQRRDLTVRNEGPLRFGLTKDGISIVNARLVSEDTDLEASGTLSFVRRNPWNLEVAGTLNLAVLGVLHPDLLASGKSVLDVSVRGSLLEPQVGGRLQFEDASFNLKELPNGLEKARGTILFDRNRATIEQFTSQTGGGKLAVSGFVGFGEDLIYRLQAKADDVRVRYPEGVSTVVDAQLEFTGSSRRTMLSGEVTVDRASFHPSTDIGSLLSQTARPDQPAAITNAFLRTMQFDVRIRTSGSGVFQTSLTRDIELEADVRLGGGPIRPVLLGRVDINEGEILFFGNRYTIVHGEVTFFNPAKIEPVIAMDLETRVRGYTVMINFSGPLNKLNFSYRSDPPLQSEEILALLTVGRAPETARSSATQSSSTQNLFQASGNSLLGQALAVPVTSRLQRLFGVSRIKIDPQLTGVDNTPETLVTVEQQLSREITLTYVTNLTRTQQQIVRIEWKFNREWSVFAVRDSNGIFGVDFVYQRRF
jgi:translocation and assembly module TamB